MLARISLVLTIGFFLFILWIIYLADTGQSSIFFDIVKKVPYGDKVGHIVLFGFLTLGINIASQFKLAKIGWFKVYIGTALVSVFVAVEEVSQHYVSSRTFDLIDLFADAIGIFIFTLVTFFLSRKSLATA